MIFGSTCVRLELIFQVIRLCSEIKLGLSAINLQWTVGFLDYTQKTFILQRSSLAWKSQSDSDILPVCQNLSVI